MTAVTWFLLAILSGLLVAALPTWSYSRDWGLGRAGAVATVLLALALMVALGRV
ncbi:MAG TPA: DUF3309 family protein [Myxococcota bacterium]|nr:DUF3309 family protein [Myxococcota bacterium]